MQLFVFFFFDSLVTNTVQVSIYTYSAQVHIWWIPSVNQEGAFFLTFVAVR